MMAVKILVLALGVVVATQEKFCSLLELQWTMTRRLAHQVTAMLGTTVAVLVQVPLNACAALLQASRVLQKTCHSSAMLPRTVALSKQMALSLAREAGWSTLDKRRGQQQPTAL